MNEHSLCCYFSATFVKLLASPAFSRSTVGFHRGIYRSRLRLGTPTGKRSVRIPSSSTPDVEPRHYCMEMLNCKYAPGAAPGQHANECTASHRDHFRLIFVPIRPPRYDTNENHGVSESRGCQLVVDLPITDVVHGPQGWVVLEREQYANPTHLF
jgi:hypothetical protein